jgi:hypothetical protein
VHYSGIVPMQAGFQLAMLEEVRDPEPPIRLSALFYEPGSAVQVAEELRGLGEIVVGAGSGADAVVAELGLPTFAPSETRALVPEGAYRDTPVFPTDPDRVFWALQSRRLPAKRHPYGIQVRIDELVDHRIVDDGGDLWHRRIEEIDALACALCAHRFAVGHASSLDGIVLPGTALPEEFSTRGVMPPVERITLPRS